MQACGDAHLVNFGMFATPERHLVFDVNDFDETLPGPWEWDVKRLAASIVVAGRANGFTPRRGRPGGARARCGAYRERMCELATMRTLDVWYARVDVDEVLADGRPQAAGAIVPQRRTTVAKARHPRHLRPWPSSPRSSTAGAASSTIRR